MNTIWRTLVAFNFKDINALVNVSFVCFINYTISEGHCLVKKKEKQVKGGIQRKTKEIKGKIKQQCPSIDRILCNKITLNRPYQRVS